MHLTIEPILIFRDDLYEVFLGHVLNVTYFSSIKGTFKEELFFIRHETPMALLDMCWMCLEF